VIQAAGILFKTGNKVLLVKRAAGGDHVGTWATPGGKLEDGETAAQAAVRECYEELGLDAETLGILRPWTRSQRDGVDYTTFLMTVEAPFRPNLNDESDDFEWADLDDPPDNLHPGLAIVLARFKMNELDIARAIADGALVSPQRYENILLCAMRITGTGVAFRKQLDEFVYRDPKRYLNDEFLARCNGLPVIVEHPKQSSLDSKEFQDRVVGTILLPYLRDQDVWGVAKIYDDAAAEMLETYVLSTSPAVVFRDQSVNRTKKLPDGSTLLVEGDPSLLDHLAICEVGVWDKGGEPSGVDSVTANGGSTVTEEEMKAAEQEKADAARKDADAGDMLDKILKCVDSLGARIDVFEKTRKDAMPEPKMNEEPGSTEEVAADKARKDAEEAEKMKAMEAEKADKARKDTEEETRKRIADLEEKMPKELSDSDYKEMAETQAKADKVHAAFGDSAPRPLQGENLLAYRKRLANGLKTHSKAWKDVDVYKLDAHVMGIAEPQIYADAMDAALHPVDLPEGNLREIVSVDTTGRRITSFAGQPKSWMQNFSSNRRRLAGIRNAS